MLNRSLSTLNVWYEAEQYAAENNIHFPFVLPEPRTDLDNRGSRFWDDEGVNKLKRFRDNLMRGDLAFYTRTLVNKTEKDLIRDDAKAFKAEHGLED
nr:MAG TPA: hypothetical protein [Caudoviricetes sp.]